VVHGKAHVNHADGKDFEILNPATQGRAFPSALFVLSGRLNERMSEEERKKERKKGKKERGKGKRNWPLGMSLAFDCLERAKINRRAKE
jgi:hypothetical protein